MTAREHVWKLCFHVGPSRFHKGTWHYGILRFARTDVYIDRCWRRFRFPLSIRRYPSGPFAGMTSVALYLYPLSITAFTFRGDE